MPRKKRESQKSSTVMWSDGCTEKDYFVIVAKGDSTNY